MHSYSAEPASAQADDLIIAEEKQRLLVSELNHRVRNMLQVVIGIANQTLHRSQTLSQFEPAFMGRLQALARAYDLLSREGWRTVPLSELLDSQLSAFAADRNRYAAQGEEVIFTANAGLAMGLILYELATNATKYGALSSAGGRIDVSWQMRLHEGSEPALVFRWTESGGPPVEQPSHQGFGSQLVQSQLQHELNGEGSMKFARAGLHVTLTIPVRNAILLSGEP